MKLLSLILCTRNRREDLRRFLEGAIAWETPGIPWELIVVDNGSTDGTGEVAASTGQKMKLPIRVIREERAGLTRARNAGYRAARGDVIAFTDDDVEPEPDWLAALVRTVGGSEHIAFGGRVLARWRAPAPDWLTTKGPHRITGGAVLEYDHGEQERPCDDTMFVPVGACMFFRREMFDRFGEFREDLGRQGPELLSGEDSEFFFRARDAGLPVIYAASVVVHHPVDPDRVTRAYHRRWYWDLGRSYARWKQDAPGRRLLGIPGSDLRGVGRELGLYLRALLLGPGAARWFRELRLRAALGQALEARRLHGKSSR